MMPNPLHPAVVHFPIVLVLLGAVLAVVAVVLRRWNLPAIAATVLTLGAISTAVALATGEAQGELVSEPGPIAATMDRHELWAERTRNASIAAAVLAIAALLTRRWRSANTLVAAGAAVVALGTGWCVVETGHYGGELVYRHAAGVDPAPAAASHPAVTEAAKARPHDDD